MHSSEYTSCEKHFLAVGTMGSLEGRCCPFYHTLFNPEWTSVAFAISVLSLPRSRLLGCFESIELELGGESPICGETTASGPAARTRSGPAAACARREFGGSEPRSFEVGAAPEGPRRESSKGVEEKPGEEEGRERESRGSR